MSKICKYLNVFSGKGNVSSEKKYKKEDELADKAVAGCLEALKFKMTMNKGTYFSIEWCLNNVIFREIKHLNNKHIFSDSAPQKSIFKYKVTSNGKEKKSSFRGQKY